MYFYQPCDLFTKYARAYRYQGRTQDLQEGFYVVACKGACANSLQPHPLINGHRFYHRRKLYLSGSQEGFIGNKETTKAASIQFEDG